MHILYLVPTQCIYVFCVDLRTNGDYFPAYNQLIGFCNRDGVSLLRGTDWVFVFCADLRTNGDYFPIQNKLTGFYNRDGVCLLRGTEWVFICFVWI
jgi:hypothetical protein